MFPQSGGCLLINVTGKGNITLSCAREFCEVSGLAFLVEVKYAGPRLPTGRKAFEAVIATAVQGWQQHRPDHTKGPSTVILDCPAAVAAGLGAQLAVHGDGPWIPYEFNNGTYIPFEPPASAGKAR